MNFSAFVGILLAATVFFGSILTASGGSKTFLDLHAFLIVGGGTFAASMISFSGIRMWELLMVFLKKVVGKNGTEGDTIGQIVDLARGYREDDGYLKKMLPSLHHPFLREAIDLMVNGGLSAEELDEILTKRVRMVFHLYEEDAENFKALSKFPPAFGLLGAVFGIISLMQNLGGQDAFQKVGPSMAVALVATLYGIAIANFIFLPLGENIARLGKKEHVVRNMICDGVRNIRAKKHPIMVEESCMSYLLPRERKAKEKRAS